MEGVSCKIKLANGKFVLAVVSHSCPQPFKKRVIIHVEIWIIEIYYFLLKSNLVVQMLVMLNIS